MISQLKCIKLQGHWIVVGSYRQRANKLTINDCLTVTIDGLKGTNDITSLHSHLIDQSDQKPEFHTINWRDTTHFYSDDDYRRGCWNSVTVNNSPIQLYVHPDDHTQGIYIKLLLFLDKCTYPVYFLFVSSSHAELIMNLKHISASHPKRSLIKGDHF